MARVKRARAAVKKRSAKPRAKSAAKRASTKKKAAGGGRAKARRRSSRDDAVQKVVRSQMPEMEIAEKRKTSKNVQRPVRPGPSISDFRRKVLGEGGAGADSVNQEPAIDDDGVEVRQVRRQQSPADPADDPGPRTVILKKKKIIGAQG